MSTTEGLRKRIDTATDLGAIVRTMKALSAVSIRQYERAAEALDAYARNVELGLQAAVQAEPPAAPSKLRRADRLGFVVLGSDQGLCGGFNEQVSRSVLDTLAGPNAVVPLRLLALGTRVIDRLEDAGLPVTRGPPQPASARGIASLVWTLLIELDAWREAGVDRIDVFHNRPQKSGLEQVRLTLLPLDRVRLRALAQRPWPARSVPILRPDWDVLFTALVRQYLFVTLHRALAESLAAEHAARLTAMQAAERNIDERILGLQADHNHLRQSSITAEILDIVSGAEALRDRAGAAATTARPPR